MAELTQHYTHRLIELEISLFPEKLFSSKSFSRRVLCTQPAKPSRISCLWIQDYSPPSAKISLHPEHTFHCPIFSSSSVYKKAFFIILLNQKYVQIQKNCYLMQLAALRTERQSPEVRLRTLRASRNSYILQRVLVLSWNTNSGAVSISVSLTSFAHPGNSYSNISKFN